MRKPHVSLLLIPPRDAIKAALTPVVISFIISFFMVIHVVALLGYSERHSEGELAYVSSLFNLLPSYSKDIVFLGFFAMFITTAESLLNWGASFLVVDAWSGWFNKKSSLRISILTMIFLSGFSILVAFNVKDLQQLIKITFSISAGVAPVFILRWIWFRINAWSQLSAMLSSGLFTLLYPWIHTSGPWSTYPMEESRVLFVSLFTTITWILVTLFTPNQSEEIKIRMRPIIPKKGILFYRLGVALLLGLFLTLINWGIWTFLLNQK